jgi:hypothetical protein
MQIEMRQCCGAFIPQKKPILSSGSMPRAISHPIGLADNDKVTE